MVMTPVYHPFFLVTQRMKREVVYSPLDLKDGQYQIDFERFRKDIQGCKVLILCNPHNLRAGVYGRWTNYAGLLIFVRKAIRLSSPMKFMPT